MDERRFSRLFPPELEHRILALLGQLDLTRTALVCRRFREMSEALLFRHIALRSVYFDDSLGWPWAVNRTLNNSCKAIFRILDNVTLGRHVRFLEVYVPWLFGIVDHGRAAAGMTTDELYTVWSSMPGLVALSVTGPVPNDQYLGLQKIDFPRLQRLELDHSDSIEFVQRHLPRLQYLIILGVTKIPLDWDITVDTLVQYEGPYLLLMRLLHAGTRTHSLESCVVFGGIGSGTPPSLAPLARYQTLRYLSIGLDGLDRATILEMIRDCPPFMGVTTLKIDFEPEDHWNTQRMPTSTDPPWGQLMRPFPAAVYIVLIVDMEYGMVGERGLAWAKEISETCKDARVIVIPDFGFTRAGPDFDWVADDDAENAIDYSLKPSVVHAVPR